MLHGQCASQEIKMTRLFADAANRKASRTHAIAAIAGVVVVALCATGIAAFAGLLPESERVAAAITAAPIIDVQVNDRRDEPDARLAPRVGAQASASRRINRERLRRAVIVA
jgi:hypothetical protein